MMSEPSQLFSEARGLRHVSLAMAHKDIRHQTPIMDSMEILRFGTSLVRSHSLLHHEHIWPLRGLTGIGWLSSYEVRCPDAARVVGSGRGYRRCAPRAVDRSRGRPGGGGSEFQDWCPCLLKVSGANAVGEPNGEPTSTGIRPHQATSSHSHRWWTLAPRLAP